MCLTKLSFDVATEDRSVRGVLFGALEGADGVAADAVVLLAVDGR